MLLLKHFPELTRHPFNAEKVMDLVLQLAVQGMLTKNWRHENPDVESAHVLLERIKAEKERLNANREIKREKTYPEIEVNEISFAIPNSWEWIRLGAYIRNFGQKVPDVTFNYIDVGSINNKKGEIESPTLIGANEAPSRARKLVRKGTVIYSTVRPYLLNISIVDKDYSPEPIASTAFAILHPLVGASSEYLFYYLRSNFFVDYVNSQMIGVAYPAINDQKLLNGIIPIPPLEEQKEIVRIVDQLKEEIDELNRFSKERLDKKHQFVVSSLHHLTESGKPEYWNLLQDHFTDTLDELDNVKKLREIILQLAVEGKLTKKWREGHPDVEPASELLKRIQKEKEKLIVEGKIKKEKTLPPISEDEIPYELPKGWEWVRLEDITNIVSGVAKGKRYSVDTKSVPYLRVANVQRGYLDLDVIKEINVSVDDFEKYQLESNDLLMIEGGDPDKLGRCAIWNDNINGIIYQNHVFRVRTFLKKETDSTYLMLFINSRVCRNYFEECAKRTTNLASINKTQMRNAPIAFPPFDEQKAIVRQVNELLSLCDTLESHIRTRNDTADNLMKAEVAEVLEGGKEEEVELRMVAEEGEK